MHQYRYEYLLPPLGPPGQQLVLSFDSTSRTFTERWLPFDAHLENFVDLADFLTEYSVRIANPSPLDVPANTPSYVNIHYFHKESGARYYMCAPGRLEGVRLPTVDLTYCMDFFDQGYARVFKPSGAMLGESGRIDEMHEFGVNPREYLKKTVILHSRDGLYSATPAQPYTQRDGLGTLRRLSREVRFEIYRLALSDTWQGYHALGGGLTLLGTGQFSAMTPALLRTSQALREDVRHSTLHSNREHEIIVGKEVIAFNFVLQSGLRPGDTVHAARARIPSGRGLFIGVQVPSPRTDADMAIVQRNVMSVVELLNEISTHRRYRNRGRIPPIRVSFQTNSQTRGGVYFNCDFELLMKPFGNLILLTRPADGRKPLVIDRALPAGTDAGRNRLCEEIELSVAR